LLGIAGVLLALPAAAVARVAFDYWMEREGPGILPSGPADEPLAPDEGSMEKEATGGRRTRRRKV
jgi:hypothetical protein